MKLRVQLFLCTALLLSSFQAPRAGDLADDARINLSREISAQISAVGLRPSKSAPETQSERSRSTSKFVTVDGTRLHFLIKGAGRPVVLIHGNPGSTQDWTRVFGPVGANHKIIAFDRPGHGRSERPKHIDATVEVQARLLHDALKQLHVERPIVVGHSWGGALALVYAINYPKEVAGVVLVAPAVYESHDGVSLTSLPAVPVIGDALNSMLTPLFGASVVRDELKKAFSPDPVPKKYLRSVLSEWTKPKKVKAYSLDEASLNDSLKKFSPRYAEINSVPVSILAGDSDLIVSEKENAERLHQALPKSHLVVLPKTGHQIPFTRPQAVVEEIERVQRLSRVRP